MTRTARLVASAAAAALLVAACGGPPAAPARSASPTASPAAKARRYELSYSSPHISVIDAETRQVVRKTDLPSFTSWTWNDDNNYFDGKSLWLGLRNPTTSDAEVIALDLDSLEVSRRLPLGKDTLTLYIGKATRDGILLVGKMGSGQVVAVDTKAGRVLWTKDVPTNGDVVCDADVATISDGTQRFVYPTRRGDTLVSLSPGTGDVVKAVDTPKGATPLMLTVAPNNLVWVQESGSNTNAVFDPVSLELVKRFPAAKGPFIATFRPDGKLAYVGHSVDPVVDVFDTASYALVKRVEVGSTPDKIAVHPNGRFVYPILSKEAAVAVIDATTWAVVDRIPIGTNPTGIFLRQLP